MISQPESYRTISPGSILVEKNTLLPEPLGFENELSKRGWAPVANNPDRRELGEELADADVSLGKKLVERLRLKTDPYKRGSFARRIGVTV